MMGGDAACSVAVRAKLEVNEPCCVIFLPCQSVSVSVSMSVSVPVPVPVSVSLCIGY